MYQDACDKHGAGLYSKVKKECDEYFWNAHRGFARGVGGVFFDALHEGSDYRVANPYQFVKDCTVREGGARGVGVVCRVCVSQTCSKLSMLCGAAPRCILVLCLASLLPVAPLHRTCVCHVP